MTISGRHACMPETGVQDGELPLTLVALGIYQQIWHALLYLLCYITLPHNTRRFCLESVIGVILGGGAGSRLYPLTKYRSKPAVPIGGKYRLIDIPISNCLHSGLARIYALTQFNSASLNRHISQTYRFDAFSNGFVEILAAEQTQDRLDWYQGTADAVSPAPPPLHVLPDRSIPHPLWRPPLPHELPRLCRRTPRKRRRPSPSQSNPSHEKSRPTSASSK